jgi:two-component system, cell cycle response regulator
MARKYQRTGNSGNRILVVDDSPEILQSTRRLLEKEGHEVYTVPNGRAALEFLQTQSVHLMVVDYFMPAMTGEELVRQIRESGDRLTQIILATGYSGEKPARVMMQQLDIQGYHDKSEGAQKLLLWVDTALKSHRHVQAMEKHRRGLRFILDLTPDLHRMQPVDELLEGLLWQLEALIGAENSFVATLSSASPDSDGAGPGAPKQQEQPVGCFIAIADTPDEIQELHVRVGTGIFKPGDPIRDLPAPVSERVEGAFQHGTMHADADCSVVPLVLGQRSIGIIYLDRPSGYARDRELLEIFASQAAAAIQNALLYDRATTDPLTGTYLRGFAIQQLEHSIKRSLRRADPLSLLMIDLDHFKQVNDQHGHPVGDRALAAVGELLRTVIRDTDIVGRYGGDEFLVILPDTAPSGALNVANRILARAATLEVEHAGGAVPIRLSVGVGTLLPEGDDMDARVDKEKLHHAVEALIASADRALYSAKGSGRAGERPVLRWTEATAGGV